uniref:Uncharacterized protein n=1 Tax=Arundo donax TaxID=35708 RepID=A0A0A9FA66_ARUDO
MKHSLEHFQIHVINDNFFDFIAWISFILLFNRFMPKKFRSKKRRSGSQHQLMGMKLLSCYTKYNIYTFLSIQKFPKITPYIRLWNLYRVWSRIIHS